MRTRRPPFGANPRGWGTRGLGGGGNPDGWRTGSQAVGLRGNIMRSRYHQKALGRTLTLYGKVEQLQ